MSDEKMRRRKTSQSRSPPPPSFLPGDPADGPESGIATAGEHVDKMSNKAEEEPYITSTKNPFALLGELKDAEAATEAADSLDKISGWPEGGIASAGKNVDKMSGCARARLKWCSRSWTMSIRMSALTRACPRMPRARAHPSRWQGNQRENAKKERGAGGVGWCWCGARRRGQVAWVVARGARRTGRGGSDAQALGEHRAAEEATDRPQ